MGKNEWDDVSRGTQGVEGCVIAHQGVRYWTTDELAASLVSRGFITGEGRQDSVRKAVRRWAADVDVRPVARTKSGGYLWPEDALMEVLDMEPCPA